MKNLIIQNQDNFLKKHEEIWTNLANNKNEYTNPTAYFYTSMVYGFANHLPYSMDIEQIEYVPADFLNMEPIDVDANKWFKSENRRTFFNSLVSWNDTFKTGMLLQICNIFQKMLLKKFPTDFKLSEEDYFELEINLITSDEKYNRSFFEILKLLPSYYKKVNESSNNDERRAALDEMYNDIMNKISARLGNFKKTNMNGYVEKRSKGLVPIRPSNDIKMLVYWDNIEFEDGIDSVINSIKEEQLKSYYKQKELSETKKLFLKK